MHNSRRAFLKTALKLSTLLVSLNPLKQLLAAVNPYPAWETLVNYARWCPNVHNLQPHKIKIISTTEADLYYDPSRLLPIGDPHCIFVTVAMGIFIEHLSIAAAPHATKIEIIELFGPITTKAIGYTRFARLKLVATTQKETLNRELILERRTSRLPFDGQPFKQAALDKIKNEAKKFDHGFSSSSEQEIVDFIIKLNQETLFEDISNEANRKELDHLFRYSKHEAALKKDGLWAKCMGFPGLLMKSVFRSPERWAEGIKKIILANYYKASFKGTTTICWFSGDFNHTNDWLRAGRMLARNWLLITQEKAYIQPFGSLITNVKAYNKIDKKLAGHKKIWMVFRVGYSQEPARSFRLSTDEIIIK